MTMRTLLILSLTLVGASRAAVPLNPAFWDNYEPYQQYSNAMIRDLIALREGDLLESASSIDGMELRIVGRNSPGGKLISARAVIDSVARQRLQVKVIPFELSPNANSNPQLTRRQLRNEEAEALAELLEVAKFWEAPYTSDTASRNDRTLNPCDEANGWIVEAVRPGSYQLIARTNCGGLDPEVAAIRDFLLELAGVSATEPD